VGTPPFSFFWERVGFIGFLTTGNSGWPTIACCWQLWVGTLYALIQVASPCITQLHSSDASTRLKKSPKVRSKPSPPAQIQPEAKLTSRIDLWICLVLLVAVFAVYAQVRTHAFINFDDPIYVTDNLHVRAGLTWDGVVWAFTTFHDSNWFPLTWLSHMLDYELFGLDSGSHHLVNLLFHAVSTLLLFFALRRMTGARRTDLRDSSLTRGERRLDCRAQGRVERLLLDAHSPGLFVLRC